MEDEFDCSACDCGPDCQVPFENPIYICGCLCCTLLIAIGAVLSIGAVPPLHYGIRYNAYNKYVDTQKVYGPGRFFLGPFNDFVLFPASAQNIEFTDEPRIPSFGRRYAPLHTRTREGLALDLEVSLQYVLQQNKVGSLYQEFNLDYESIFTSIIRDTLINAASDFQAADFWGNREEVATKMQDMVNKALSKTYANCWGLQFLDIELPDAFDKSIVATQVQKQQIDTEGYAQLGTQIRAQTRVIEAEFDRLVKVIRAHGQANFTLITKVAQAEAKQMVIDYESSALQVVRDDLKLSGMPLVQYQQYNSIRFLKNASLYYGFKNDSQVMLSALGTRRLGAVQDSTTQVPSMDALSLPSALAQRRLKEEL